MLPNVTIAFAFDSNGAPGLNVTGLGIQPRFFPGYPSMITALDDALSYARSYFMSSIGGTGGEGTA